LQCLAEPTSVWWVDGRQASPASGGASVRARGHFCGGGKGGRPQSPPRTDSEPGLLTSQAGAATAVWKAKSGEREAKGTWPSRSLTGRSRT
jgi:hypothetical protein